VSNARIRQAPRPDAELQAARQMLGARLRVERESRGWSYRELAGKLSDASPGIGPVPGTASIIPQIRRWERGGAGISQRYWTLYCIVFAIRLDLWDLSQT
jgi:transcriptional regulator with XRE-family HTH domain